MSLFPIIATADASRRLAEAVSYVAAHVSSGAVTIVGANRDVADDVARVVARTRPATVGVSRFSLVQLAARIAGPVLAAQGVAPSTPLAFEALAARAVFDRRGDASLDGLAGASSAPGFPRAVARTVAELRAAGVGPDRVRAVGTPVATGLATLYSDIEAEFDVAAAVDHERLLRVAADAVAGELWLRAPLVLVDVAPRSTAEQGLLAALVGHARTTLATCHVRDETSRLVLERLGGVTHVVQEPRESDLDHLRARLFSADHADSRPADGAVEALSAPGESRECVEIARRILREAASGVPFDEMAVFLRSPDHYQGLLEHALTRAGVPAWFDRGTRRPHPVGRAFLALLACADERLSARRFAEYLSLGQLPTLERTDDGVCEDPVPAPRRWEQMLVEAAVRRGDPVRWRRRLDGLQAELIRRHTEAVRDDPESARGAGIARDAERLRALAVFALPLIEEMAEWPREATWGDWLGRLEAFAPRVVGAAGPLLAVLTDLRPMARVGPVTLSEVRQVLADRLRHVEDEPPVRRHGRVFVGRADRARGRSFAIVFVPGLAERMFPERLRQDPLLLDDAREALSPALATHGERAAEERLLLHMAVGACRRKLYVSYPRLDVSESRVRVPSFYALDVVRGVTGTLPDHRVFAETAGHAGRASLAWPAPEHALEAIDVQEHDLASVRALLDADPSVDVRGRAQYILRMNTALRRSVVERWARASTQWSQYDGLVRLTDGTRAALAAQRLTARTYSASALQRFAACPYQFLLGSVYRLHPPEGLEALQYLDPLTRGSLVHRIQALTLRALGAGGLLPITVDALPQALATLSRAGAEAAEEFREEMAPAIDRVWGDEVSAVMRDLRGWVRRMATDDGQWVARYVELGFGLHAHPDRDAASRQEPVLIAGRYPLRGAIDLVEVHRTSGALRVTDHKTGKNRTVEGLAVGGGATLQPLLYAEAAEQVLAAPVSETRLFFCTVAGGYGERVVPLTPQNRRLGIEALEIIDRAIETGVLVPAPADGACARCDFVAVCGPTAAEQAGRKTTGLLRDLDALRRQK